FGAEDIAQEVDVQDGVPALGAGFDHGVIHAYPGVIHQDVELAKVVHGALHKRGDFGFLLHVRFDKHDVATTGLNFCSDALTTLDITIGKSHLRPFGDEAPHGGLPNPRRPARDGGHSPTELSHRHALLCMMPDPVRTLALLVWRWPAMILASVGESHDLCHPRRAPTLSSTLRHRNHPPGAPAPARPRGQASWRVARWVWSPSHVSRAASAGRR